MLDESLREVQVMRQQVTVQRRPWHALTEEEKQERLAELRERQQRQIEREARRLRR